MCTDYEPQIEMLEDQKQDDNSQARQLFDVMMNMAERHDRPVISGEKLFEIAKGTAAEDFVAAWVRDQATVIAAEVEKYLSDGFVFEVFMCHGGQAASMAKIALDLYVALFHELTQIDEPTKDSIAALRAFETRFRDIARRNPQTFAKATANTSQAQAGRD